MGSTDGFVVRRLLHDFRQSDYPNDTEQFAFERLAAREYLKPLEPSVSELEQGIVDGSQDGGIDSVYVAVNGSLIDVDSPLLDKDSASTGRLAQHPAIDVIVIQSKHSEAWKESVWEKFLSALPELLDPQSAASALEQIYNEKLVERTGIYRRAVIALLHKFPQVNIRIAYVSLATEENLTPVFAQRAAQVERAVAAVASTGAEIISEHVGVEKLYARTASSAQRSSEIVFDEVLELSNAVLGVARIDEYLQFLRSSDGELRQDVFEANVRDYEGQNQVNSAIQSTLTTAGDSPFWWINNGITVIGDKVQRTGKRVTISRPLVVNGLQTSHVIDRTDKAGDIRSERLTEGLVIRVFESSDETVRDAVIAGTNRQTRVTNPALFASEPLQQEIERFLLAHDWYYERRKNRYRNLGKPAARRVSIGELAQAMLALLRAEPDVARARPSTALQNDYAKIFVPEMRLEVYLYALELMRDMENFLRSEKGRSFSVDASNARFHLLTGYALAKLGASDNRSLRFEKNWKRVGRKVDVGLASHIMTILDHLTRVELAQNPMMSRDALFKSAAFRSQFITAVARDSASSLDDALKELEAVFDTWIKSKESDGIVSSNVLTVGIRVSESIRAGLPVSEQHYVTAGGTQVSRLTGSRINAALSRHGVQTSFSSEGGRTSRGSLPLAHELVDLVNAWSAMFPGTASPGHLEAIAFRAESKFVSEINRRFLS